MKKYVVMLNDFHSDGIVFKTNIIGNNKTDKIISFEKNGILCTLSSEYVFDRKKDANNFLNKELKCNGEVKSIYSNQFVPLINNIDQRFFNRHFIKV